MSQTDRHTDGQPSVRRFVCRSDICPIVRGITALQCYLYIRIASRGENEKPLINPKKP